MFMHPFMLIPPSIDNKQSKSTLALWVWIKTGWWRPLLVLLHTHEVRPISELRGCVRRLWRGWGRGWQAFHCKQKQSNMMNTQWHAQKKEMTKVNCMCSQQPKTTKNQWSQRNEWRNWDSNDKWPNTCTVEVFTCWLSTTWSKNKAPLFPAETYLLPACCVWRLQLPARTRY